MLAALDRPMSLGHRIRELRELRGLTQEQLVARINGPEEQRLTVSALSKIEQGAVANPRWGTIRKIAQVLDASLDDWSKRQDLPGEPNERGTPKKKKTKKPSKPKKPKIADTDA